MEPLLHPLEVGGVTLPNNLVLSPMAGFSDRAFRILCRRRGAGLVCTEMVSASAVARHRFPGEETCKSVARMLTTPEERPVCIQLFGTDPEDLARAAQDAARDCDVLGLNMGCPAWQVKRAGCGAALLDRPDVAAQLVETVTHSSRRPLLVKIRAGNAHRIDVARFAQRLENAGAAGVIFHARTAGEGYSGRADWSLIRSVKQALGIPVIGNGDVTDGRSAALALRESGCDGLAIGRAALGDPGIFGRVGAYLISGAEREVDPRERIADLAAYIVIAGAAGLPRTQVLAQAQRFTRGLAGAARLRARLAGLDPHAMLDEVRRHVDPPLRAPPVS